MKKPVIGLALGGGAAKGLAHIGVLKALEENGIFVDMVSGCSSGALIGGLYCSGLTPYELEDIAINMEYKNWIDLTIPAVGVIKGKKIETMLKKLTKDKSIEDLDKKFLAVATDLNTSKRYVFESGPIYEAIRASISIPGIFEPIGKDGMVLVDGGVVDRFPVSILRDLKPDLVIGSNIAFSNLNQERINIFDVIIQSAELLTDLAMKTKELKADVVIEPDLETIGLTRFDLAKEAITFGYDATILNIVEIKKQIAMIR